MSMPIEPADAARHRARAMSEAANDRILALAPYLGDRDRALIEQVYARGQAVAEVARAADVPAKRLNRRLSRILRRIRQPVFQFVATRGDVLPREAAATARYAVLEGYPLRQVAALTGQSLHRVRQHMQTIHNYHRLVSRQMPR